MLTAIIPARAGSKRIPNKNQQFIGGSSLLSRAIANAQLVASRVIVSSEDAGYLHYASSMGCEIHERNDALAMDDCHAVYPVLAAMEDMNVRAGNVAMMLPTAALVSPDELHQAEGYMMARKAPAIVGMLEKKITNIYRPSTDGSLRRSMPYIPVEQQDTQAAPVYVVTGEIFIADAKALLEHRSFHMDGVIAYLQANPHDINEMRDLDEARRLVA